VACDSQDSNISHKLLSVADHECNRKISIIQWSTKDLYQV
jgi:hypothetical protein